MKVLQEFYEKNPEMDQGYLSMLEDIEGYKSIFVNITDIIREILGDIVVEAWYQIIHAETIEELEKELEMFELDIKEIWEREKRLEFECQIHIKFVNDRVIRMTSAEWGYIYQ